MSASKNASRKVSTAGRRRALFALAVTALLVVPAALSWACGPNRAVQLDRFDYHPGDPVTVTGSNFEVGATVFVTVNGDQVAQGTASGTGNLTVTFNAPATPGTYTLATQGVDQNGQALAGTGGTQSFTVSPVPSTSGGGSGGGSTSAPSPGTTRAPAPGSTGAQPGATRQSGSNSTSGRERSRAGAQQRSGATAPRGSAPSRSGGVSGGVNTTEGVIRTAGTTAFAGSVTRQDRVAAATKAKAKSKAKAGSPAQADPAPGTATADLWSGFASAKNPSLMPSTGNSGVPAGGTGSGATLGLALLGLGMVALLGLAGLTAASRRRRRVPGS